jgi:class 3 adenylate cyclase
MQGMPIHYDSQRIGNAVAYVESRRPRIAGFLAGEQPIPTFGNASQEYLQSLSVNEERFVILSFDIVGSTKLATTLPTAKYAKLIQTVLFELSEVVPQFHGHVLSYGGDGFVAYFAAPNFIGKNDLAIDCALTLRRLVYQGLNPVLTQSGYPSIDIRIGLDSGEAAVVVIGSDQTKQQSDLVGEVVNLACKIQAQAPSGGIALGAWTLRNLHTHWRQRCVPLELPGDWGYKDTDGAPYPVFRVAFVE